MATPLRSRIRNVRHYLTRRSDGLPGPASLLLETTNRCNLACPMCPRTHRKQWNRDMPDERLFGALEAFAAAGGDHVLLYGLGEPLLDQRMPTILRRCRELGLGTVLSTNGVLLDEGWQRALLESPCDHLLVGIDGVTEATYDRYRPGGGLALVEAQVRAFAAAKKAARVPTTLVVQLIRMAGNEHEVAAFERRWRSVPGVDLVRVKEEDIGLPEHRTSSAGPAPRRNPCHILWRGTLVVRANGDVYACYHLADVQRERPLGNLADHSLLQLWNHPRLVALRELHAGGSIPAEHPCARCPAARPVLPAVLGAMLLPGTATRALLPVVEKVARRVPAVLREPRTP